MKKEHRLGLFLTDGTNREATVNTSFPTDRPYEIFDELYSRKFVIADYGVSVQVSNIVAAIIL